MRTAKIVVVLCFISLLVACGQVLPTEGDAAITITEKPTSILLTNTPTTALSIKATQLPSLTPLPPTSTSTETPTETLLSTLNVEQTEEIIRTLLYEPVDCSAPCFWGITPQETTLNELITHVSDLGLPIASTTVDHKLYYGTHYEFENNLSVRVVFPIEDEIVKNIEIRITAEQYQPGVSREWLAYSPETLIARYDTPSKAGFWMGRAAGPKSLSMVMYFDEVDLIVEYDTRDFDAIYAGEKLSHRVCLLTNQINHIRIWIGKNPEYPPGGDTPLEEATSLTLDEFAALMLGDPKTACIELEDEAFPE